MTGIVSACSRSHASDARVSLEPFALGVRGERGHVHLKRQRARGTRDPPLGGGRAVEPDLGLDRRRRSQVAGSERPCGAVEQQRGGLVELDLGRSADAGGQQDQASHALGMGDGQIEGESTTERVAQQPHAFRCGLVQHAGEVVQRVVFRVGRAATRRSRAGRRRRASAGPPADRTPCSTSGSRRRRRAARSAAGRPRIGSRGARRAPCRPGPAARSRPSRRSSHPPSWRLPVRLSATLTLPVMAATALLRSRSTDAVAARRPAPRRPGRCAPSRRAGEVRIELPRYSLPDALSAPA